jgi:hypothetical protein
LKCRICHLRNVKYRCLDQNCDGFKDCRFYDACSLLRHDQHEHILMTEEDKEAALDYFELLKEEEAESKKK